MPALLSRALQVSLVVGVALADQGGLRGVDVGEVQKESADSMSSSGNRKLEEKAVSADEVGIVRNETLNSASVNTTNVMAQATLQSGTGKAAAYTKPYLVTNNLYVCPAGYMESMDQQECQAAADALGLGLTFKVMTDAGDPRGCWAYGDATAPTHLYFNLGGTTSNGRRLRNAICKADYLVTDNMYVCPAEYKHVNQQECQAAADALGLGLTVGVMTDAGDPKGCWASGDATAPTRLYFNLGGTTHNGRPFRNAICKADPYLVTSNLFVCPAAYKHVDQQGCQAAADALGLGLTVGVMTDGGDPRGCWAYGDAAAPTRLYFNLGGTTHNNRPLRNAICRADSYSVTENLYVCPAGYKHVDQQECQAAADALGLGLTVGVMTDAGDPKGCWAYGDATAPTRLYFNLGGTTNNGRPFRNAICESDAF